MPRRTSPARQMLAAHLLDALLAGDGLARALAGAGVGPGALAADRQALAMAGAAVAADVAQPGDVLLLLPPQLTLDGILAVEDARDAGDVFLVEVARLALRVHLRLGADLQGGGRADAPDVAQGDVRRLVVGQIDTH